MAVEASQLNIFHPGIISNREFMIEDIGNVCGTPLGYGAMPPISGTTVAMDSIFPMYGLSTAQTVPATTPAIKSDSGLTYAAVPASRKRSRDALNYPVAGVHSNRGNSYSFLGEDLSVHFLQQQLEIDQLIAQHTEKVRTEIEDRRKRYCRRIEQNMVKKLKAKEEEIIKIGKMNFALEERVKSLCFENQILKEMAQTNEATANALRFNLEHVLAQHRGGEAAVADDAQSSCGSALAESRSNRDDEKSSRRTCRWCGKEESCVLLLPCRHLCLCTACSSSLLTCPVCSSAKTATVHVNISAS